MRFRIPNPCGEDWDAMEVRGHGRHCASCDHVVVDFTRMTRDKAEAFVKARGGRRICGRMLFHEATGEAWFPPPEARASSWSGGLVLVAALTSAGCGASGRAGAAEVVEVAEVADEPMLPVEGPTLATVEAPYTGPVPAAELNPAPGDVVPTAEQRARTARKHAHPVATPSPYPPGIVPLGGDLIYP